MESATWRYVMKNLAPKKKVVIATAFITAEGGHTSADNEMWDLVQDWGRQKWGCPAAEIDDNLHTIEVLREWGWKDIKWGEL